MRFFRSVFQSLTRWARQVHLAGKLAIALTIAAILAGVATYAALTETPPFGTDPTTVTILLTLDIVILLALGGLIARRIVNLVVRLRRRQAGSRLHIRMAAVFGLLAITPAIVVAIFSAIFFHLGIQSWFNERVETAVNESLAVAQAYLREHQQVIKADALAMAADLNREADWLQGLPHRFSQLVASQAAVRSLGEAIVFDGSGRILARGGLSFALEFEPVAAEVLDQARRGEVILMIGQGDDRVRALLRLDNYVDTFLFVGRMVEPRVLAHMVTAQKAVEEYRDLEGRAFGLQLTVTIIFIIIALLLLMAAVWFGLNFATALVRPISALIVASEKIRGGDLSVRVLEGLAEPEDELGTLSKEFNRMTGQLEAQRSALIDANRQLDTRRRFTEAVLSGVSAGVLGLGLDGRITALNDSALRLLGAPNARHILGFALLDIVPEMGALFLSATEQSGAALAQANGQAPVEGQVEIKRGTLPPRTLLVRFAAEQSEPEGRGFVVTFDDITDLLTAQRKAAWADVARRIAHEIKNPLTPIQLSAERLRRKYLHEIHTDPDVFQSCIDTITRQVADIGRMVDEFSNFARMPQPIFRNTNLSDLCRQAIFLQSTVTPHLLFQADMPADDVHAACDGRLLAQALTNVMKNAAEAIEARQHKIDAEMAQGEIRLRLKQGQAKVAISIEDNGAGLPEADKHKLTEPYVTNRIKGTGLGLAIVKKIIEDHNGHLSLENRNSGGARVTLVLPTDLPTMTEFEPDEAANRVALR